MGANIHFPVCNLLWLFDKVFAGVGIGVRAGSLLNTESMNISSCSTPAETSSFEIFEPFLLIAALKLFQSAARRWMVLDAVDVEELECSKHD